MTETRAIVLPKGTLPARRHVRRRWPMTVLGVLFLAVMIFPVYWMINSSLQANAGAATTAWLPLQPTLDGYVTALKEQGGNLVTSTIIALSTVVLTIAIATPAAYGLARFRMRGMTVCSCSRC
jgi:multiple sugar transport system permease protein